LSVLVVDNNLDVADSLARYLRVGVGHETRVAYDGATAVRMASAIVPDVIVCDIAMPRLDGLRAAEVFAKLEPRPLLIAVTAFPHEFSDATASAAGYDFYLVKPADPFVIEALIRDGRGAV
jgi:CheY-like chemotaxis protein